MADWFPTRAGLSNNYCNCLNAYLNGLLNNINEDSQQALVELSEHQMGDDLQYVDVEIDAEKADDVKGKKLI